MGDQTAKQDEGKLRLSLVPPQIIRDVAEVREYGCKKYKDPDNWKRVEIKRYRDAAYRHLLAYIEDPAGKDEESGIEHYKHLACNLAFICELEKKGVEMESLNLNDRIKVKLTPLGVTIFYHQYDDLLKDHPQITSIKPRMPQIDKDGYTNFQLWSFIQLYGDYIHMGADQVIEDNRIYFETVKEE